VRDEMKTAYCQYCEREVNLYRGKFIPHGDSLGPCPNSGRKPYYLYKCLGCERIWVEHKMPKKCGICEYDEFIELNHNCKITDIAITAPDEKCK
jgi:hypothetical protein